jgi:hypothetical protein
MKRLTALIGLAAGACRAVLLIASALLGAQPASAQDRTWDAWGQPLADTLLTLVPAPPPGLVDSVPWSRTSPPRASPGNSLCGTGVISGCALFYGVTVAKQWFIYDSALVARVVELTRRGDSLVARVSRQTPQDELNRILRETRVIGAESDSLKRSLSEVSFALTANETPARLFGPGTRSTGAIRGYPFYRAGHRFAVYVGPSDFSNPMAAPEQPSRTEVKSLMVNVWLGSERDDFTDREQAMVRQLLERVDYAGLAKLLTP